VRTSLDQMDIDDGTRKQLRDGGIVDVEGIVEVDPEKLAGIVGGADVANRLIAMAKKLLESAPTPEPGSVRTPLDRLDIDDPMRKRLMQSGIVDVEGVLESDARKLARIVGSREAATKLVDMANQVLDSSPRPRERPRRSPRKAPARKKRK
jgi:hypothetical protein